MTGLLDIGPAEKQAVLETIELLPRLDLVITKLAYRLEVLRLSNTIGQQTRQAMEGRQREFMLREQLKAIQKELGDADDAEPGLDDLKRKLEAAGMPDAIASQARRELRRLEKMPDGATESGMVRTYLEWLAELPWQMGTEPPIDVAAARRVLDEDHFDLDKIKRRILEFLAVRKLNPDGKGPILCFVGPARRRQDLVGPIHRPRHRTPVRPGEPWAACMTRPRSAATAAPMSARCQATSSRRYDAPARATAS